MTTSLETAQLQSATPAATAVGAEDFSWDARVTLLLTASRAALRCGAPIVALAPIVVVSCIVCILRCLFRCVFVSVLCCMLVCV